MDHVLEAIRLAVGTSCLLDPVMLGQLLRAENFLRSLELDAKEPPAMTYKEVRSAWLTARSSYACLA